MRESSIETRLVKEIKKIGGLCLKWVSPGTVGVPDRLVLLPKGQIIFVELKAPGEEPRAIQEYRIKQLRDLGFRVEVIDTIQKINMLIGDLKDGMV